LHVTVTQFPALLDGRGVELFPSDRNFIFKTPHTSSVPTAEQFDVLSLLKRRSFRICRDTRVTSCFSSVPNVNAGIMSRLGGSSVRVYPSHLRISEWPSHLTQYNLSLCHPREAANKQRMLLTHLQDTLTSPE
jgi:hypothetical protein